MYPRARLRCFFGDRRFFAGRLRAMWQASEEIAELIDSANATAEKPLTREEGAILGAKVEPSGGRQSVVRWFLNGRRTVVGQPSRTAVFGRLHSFQI